MVNTACRLIINYFRQFFTREGCIRLILALLVMVAAFKFNAGDVNAWDNREFLLLLASGIVPFFLITILQ